jgi:hypothetical protein
MVELARARRVDVMYTRKALWLTQLETYPSCLGYQND